MNGVDIFYRQQIDETVTQNIQEQIEILDKKLLETECELRRLRDQKESNSKPEKSTTPLEDHFEMVWFKIYSNLKSWLSLLRSC